MADRIAQRERIFKALANRRRIAIIVYLKKRKEAAVGDIAGTIRLSFKATSKHLNILNAANILEREQRSLQMYYRLASDMPSATRSVVSLL
ncbi:MAG: metalloregulator ArsR/SmtB family transcription factor [bacterium]|nr:metalloregulator ArsR/SmtB family transcription factor [bacterium]